MGLRSLFKKSKKEKPMELPPPPPPQTSGLEAPSGALPPAPGAPPAPEPPRPVELATPEPDIEMPSVPELPEEEWSAPEPSFPTLPEEDIPEIKTNVSEKPVLVQEPAISEPAPESLNEMELESSYPESQPDSVISEVPRQMFVHVDEYQNILNSVGSIKTSIKNAESMISKLTDLKSSEDKIFKEWKSKVEEVEKKLVKVDEVLAKGKGL